MTIENYIARKRRGAVIRKLAGISRWFVASYENLDYRLAFNGEMFVLKVLSGFPITTIFDVGANVGEWSVAAATFCPQAAIHCFEISGDTFGKLVRNTANLRSVHCVNVGLAERDGTVRLHHYDSAPGLTTMFDYPRTLPARDVSGRVRTGSAYCREVGVSHIDFLKIDVEGMEHLVLEGFDPMFDGGLIDLVQFEYGRVNILSKFLLRDFYEWLEAKGFVVGKIYPTYVDFRGYSMEDENFFGPNYLACRSCKVDLLRALRG